MRPLVILFFWAMFISFLGTIPIGTLNVAAMQIAIEEGLKNAYYFSLGGVLVEIIYVRISLVAIDWIMKREKLLKYMEWATFIIIVALAVGSFIAAAKGSGGSKGNFFLQNNMHRFLLGIVMSALNPVQIPFWFGWSTVLITKKVLQPNPVSYNVYVIALGLGTVMGQSIFILGGPWLVSKIANARDYLNWIIGGIFTITATIQLIKILRDKGIKTKMNKIKADKQVATN